jgi:hypothetical protein
MSDKIEFLKVSRDFKAHFLRKGFSSNKQTAERVHSIWSDAKKIQPSLYDDGLLCVEKFDEKAVYCYEAPYSYYFAQRDHEFKEIPKLIAFAVTGVILVDGFLIIGRRAAKVTTYPGKLELAPSGTISASMIGDGNLIDYEKQLVEEMYEELNIQHHHVDSMEPLALTPDPSAASLELFCQLNLKSIKAEQIMDNFQIDEYAELQALRPEEVRRSILENPGDWVPTTSVLLERLPIKEPCD